MKKILSKVEKAMMRLNGISLVSGEEKQEFYQSVNNELPNLEEKLNKWNPKSYEKKRLKSKLMQTLDSLKISMKSDMAKNYTRDCMMFGYIRDNFKKGKRHYSQLV